MDYRAKLETIYEAFLAANPAVPKLSADEAQMELRWEIEPRLNRGANGTFHDRGTPAQHRAAERCREQQIWLGRFIRVWERMEDLDRDRWNAAEDARITRMMAEVAA